VGAKPCELQFVFVMIDAVYEKPVGLQMQFPVFFQASGQLVISKLIRELLPFDKLFNDVFKEVQVLVLSFCLFVISLESA